MTGNIFSNLIFSLNATMPIFFMMVIGYGLREIGWLKEPTIGTINKLVFKLFLPALLVIDLAKQDFTSIWDGQFVLFCLIATILSIFIAACLSLFNKNKKDRGEMIQAGYRSAAATLGIVYMANIYDNAAMVSLMIIGSVPLYNIFAVLILILQQFDGLYLGPKILGDQTGIKPLWVIFAITVGGAYFGVMGMFLGVPTVAVINYLVNMAIEKKLKKKEIDSMDTQ